MADSATRRLRGLGTGFLVIGAVVVAAGPAPGAGSGSAADLERLRLPAVRGTCTPAPPTGSAAAATCVVPSAASSALPKGAAPSERTLPAPPIAKCDDVPPASLPLDEPRLTEC
jgi:hypothetical protein